MHLQLRQPIGVFKSSRVGTVEDRPARPHRARVCVRLCLCACRAHTCACICMCIHQPKQAQTRRYKPLTHITHGVCVCVCACVCARAHTHTQAHARAHSPKSVRTQAFSPARHLSYTKTSVHKLHPHPDTGWFLAFLEPFFSQGLVVPLVHSEGPARRFTFDML